MKRKTKGRTFENLLAVVAGFGYYWYLFIHQTIKIVDPTFLFFSLLFALFIVSLFMNKVYFYLVFLLTTLISWTTQTDWFAQITQGNTMF